ncbi:GGDEF domain-containing protein [Hahella sp. HN01]|uniref:GGDEF domain-containing protein n=1 Tax=Hahella sp. HN01 TaxID=2847262 RepID=UPI001C1ED076|nr:GGDEF domain-containing protein [Hahella sp. HN01]
MSSSLDERIKSHQHIRKRRTLMTFGSYLLTFAVAMAGWASGLLELRYAVHFLIMSVAINGGFYLCFLSNWNLSRKDPNLTEEQMLVSLFPPLYIMYFMDDNQARSAVAMVAIIPLLYGILGIDTKRYIRVAAAYFGGYLGLLGLLLWLKPRLVTPNSELVLLTALFMVMAQMALIGGFISNLRASLRAKNHQLNEALEKISVMASTDELTGLCTRRELMKQLSNELSRCRRSSGALSLCLLDIDHFKRINDSYGHQAGDAVLKKVAETMQSLVRSIDCLGRYGGEEFLLILPQTPLDGAFITAERLRRAVMDISFPEVAPEFRVTISLGAAELEEGEAMEGLIARADQALYAAKGAGRNRVVSAEQTADTLT